MQNEGRLSTQGDSVDYFVSLGYVTENVEVPSHSYSGENDCPSGKQEKGPTCGTQLCHCQCHSSAWSLSLRVGV